MEQAYDIVIVGSGIGGLSTLLYLTETPEFKLGKLSICLIAKSNLNTTNTDWAQGGIAAVHALTDHFEKHIQETLIAGSFANNKFIVEKVVHTAPTIINDLIKWGTQFDKNNNEFDLAKEGGHSEARIWHKADQTGHAIQSALINELKKLHNLAIFENTSLLQANHIGDNSFALQLYDMLNGQYKTVQCNKLVLATGGLGMLYSKTTNQEITTGDGIVLAKKLGATIQNLSYIQFHPTGLYEHSNISFLISEALRGAGAILRNEVGEAFMIKYDERKDLAPRDIVSRSIIQEISSQKNKYVYLDATKINLSILNNHFPTIKDTCKEKLGIDIEYQMIPVVPVQHYSCGGIQVNEFGETTVPNLFAIGELANTGLHGANRLASNSLLEAIVFAKYSVEKLKNASLNTTYNNEPFITPATYNYDLCAIQNIMSTYAGIKKSTAGLSKALELLLEIKNKTHKDSVFSYTSFEAGCVLETAILLIQDAQQQKENKGVFYNINLV